MSEPVLDAPEADIDLNSAARVRITKSLLCWGGVGMLGAALVILGIRVGVQQYSVRQIKRLQARVFYSGELDGRGKPIPGGQPYGPPLFRRIFGDDFFDVPIAVHMAYGTGGGAGSRLMPYVGTLRQLRSFDVGSMGPLNDEDLRHLSRLRELKELGLMRGIEHDSDLAMPRGLPLELLSLHGTYISDKGLESLQNMTSLEYLDLKETRVSDQGLRFLEKLPNLKHLSVSRTGVTPEGVARFRSKCPRCRVTRDLPTMMP